MSIRPAPTHSHWRRGALRSCPAAVGHRSCDLAVVGVAGAGQHRDAFPLGVLVIAYYCNRPIGVIVAAVLSVALFDFLYVPPLFSFAVNDIQYLLTFAVMLTVALTIGHLTSALRRRADDAERASPSGPRCSNWLPVSPGP